MALLAPNAGEREMLKRIVGDTGDNLTLRLYDNDITPAEGDTIGTYSISGGTGYGDTLLTGDSWTIETAAGDTTAATYAQKSFVYTGGDTVYGYYIMGLDSAGDSVVLIAEKFSDGHYTIPSGGGTINITPRIELE